MGMERESFSEEEMMKLKLERGKQRGQRSGPPRRGKRMSKDTSMKV